MWIVLKISNRLQGSFSGYIINVTFNLCLCLVIKEFSSFPHFRVKLTCAHTHKSILPAGSMTSPFKETDYFALQSPAGSRVVISSRLILSVRDPLFWLDNFMALTQHNQAHALQGWWRYLLLRSLIAAATPHCAVGKGCAFPHQTPITHRLTFHISHYSNLKILSTTITLKGLFTWKYC